MVNDTTAAAPMSKESGIVFESGAGGGGFERFLVTAEPGAENDGREPDFEEAIR